MLTSADSPVSWVPRIVYGLILVGLVAGLVRLGPEPWIMLAEHGQTLALVGLVAAGGMLVQALSFQSVLAQPHTVALRPLVHLWCVSGLVSLVAPLLAGVATRTALLRTRGVPVRASLLATARQSWLGMEAAALLGGLAALGLPQPLGPRLTLASSLLLVWGLMRGARATAARRAFSDRHRIGRLLRAMAARPAPGAVIWYPAQVLLMALSYALVYTEFGAALTVAGAVALAAATILGSVLVMIPNGLGLFDAVWVAVGLNSGLDIHAAVAVALSFRLTFLIGAASLLALLSAAAALRAGE